MTVHAHPDDETIGTGGAMVKAIEAGHRVVLITCTRGEQGEIVVPDMDTPENHRRLGRDPGGRARAGHGAPRRHRVGEPGLPRLGHDGPARQPRSADVLAGRSRRGDRAARLVRAALPARRHHDLQRLRRLRPPGPHPDPPRGGRGVRAGRRRGLVPGAARARGRRHGPLARRGRPRAVDRHRSSTSRRSRPRSGRGCRTS